MILQRETVSLYHVFHCFAIVRCCHKYVLTECFLPGIDQSTMDNSTEHWLDTIEEMLDYKAWHLGHWHINKRIDKMLFLMHDVEMLIE